MQWLAEICVRRPIFATVLTLLIVVLGVFGYTQLGVDRFPRVDFPVITVATVQPGAAPADVESDITDKIEAAVNTIGDIEELRSISSEGISLVVIQFKLEKDVDVAAQDVRDRVSRIRNDLPDAILEPVISKVDPDAAPILYLAVKSDGSRSHRDVTELADTTLREALEVLPGVGQVRILGGQKRTVHLWVDPLALRSLGIAVGEVARAVGTQNLTVPGGRVETGPTSVPLRVHGRVEDARDVSLLPIREVGGRMVHVGDVARVEDGAAEAESAALWNGEPAVVLALRKQSGTNTIAVADAVFERVDELTENLPSGFSVDVIRDESRTVRTSTSSVRDHLVEGAIFAALVVLAFLGNLRSTVIAALAIPTSVLGTFAVMWYLGYTLNTITLLALALAVGIVIDDAIVVLENIFRHVEEHGQSPMVAAVEGTREIGLAVMATTLSLIAVFMPVVFIAGIPGRFLRGFGVTMSVAITVSLFVSFTLTPMLASRWLAPHGAQKGWLERLVDVFYRPLETLYMRVLGFSMRHRWVVVVAAVASMATLPPLVMVAKKGFLPTDDQAQFEVNVRAPEGYSLENTALAAERIARELRDWPEVSHTVSTVGGGDISAANVATVYVALVDPELRGESQQALMDRARTEVLANVDPGFIVTAGEVAAFGGTGQSTARIQYNLAGPDLDELEKTTATLVERLRAVPGAVDVSSSLVSGKPELGVYVDREKAAQLGVNVLDVATTLRLLVGGELVSTFAESGRQYEIRVRAEPQFRADKATLGLVSFPTRSGMVSLADIAEIREEASPSSINRLGRQRVVNITANAAPGYGDSAIGDALNDIYEELNLPKTFQLLPSGQTKLMAQTGQSVLFGFGLAFIFMYLILAAQFESWLHPFTILLSLPLTLPFAVLSIVLTGAALDMFSALGIFVLFGIVKKNAILQIDHTNQLRERGMERLPAILQANRDRLRPILMTTVAFVAGMIPLVLSQGVGAGFNKATAGVVVGGQTLSLLLTLLATPVAYSILDDLVQGLGRLYRRFA